jgi:hypothetical protein
MISAVTAPSKYQTLMEPQVSSDGKIVYAPMSNSNYDPATGQQVWQMWRSKDYGKTWVKVNIGGNGKHVATGGFQMGCVSGDGKTLWRMQHQTPAFSTDYGDTFTKSTSVGAFKANLKDEGLHAFYYQGITCSHDGKNLAFAAETITVTGKAPDNYYSWHTYGARIYTSTDGGASWSKKILPCLDNACGVSKAIRFCGSDSKNIVIGSNGQAAPKQIGGNYYRKPNPGSQGLAVSKDFGVSWKTLSGTGLASYGGYSNFACPNDGSTLMAAALYTDKTNPLNLDGKGYIMKIEFK